MSKKIDLLEVIKIGAVLFVITAAAAVLLAFVNLKTAPKIAENDMKKTQAAMKVILPEANSFKKLEQSETAGVAERYAALDASGNPMGACVIASVNGYGGEIRVMTGVDKDAQVSGVDILSHSETPGLGANAVKDEFKGQFNNKSGEIDVVKTNAGEQAVNAMSGATITSKAVTRAVNIGLKEAEQILKDSKEGTQE